MYITLPSPVRTFLHEHDDLPAFHAAYLFFTILAAALLSAGVFALLMVVHMAFDVFKYRTKEHLSWKETVHATVRESLPDLTLLSLCLTFAVYLHQSLELIAGFSGLLHAEVSIVRALGSVLPKMGIGKRILDVLFRGHPQFLKRGSHRSALTLLEWICLGSLGILLVLLLVAPTLLLITPAFELAVLREHLSPLRF